MEKIHLNILTIGTDETIFDKNSLLRQRVRDYGANFTSFHIFCKSRVRRQAESTGNVVIHPLSVFFPFLISSLYRISSKLLQKKEQWVVSAENPFLEGFLAFLLSRFFSKPLHLQVHTDVFSPWYRRAGWKEYIRFWLAKFLIPRAECMRVVSERIRDSVLRRFNLLREVKPPKITVLPIFTDVAKFLNAPRDLMIDERFKNYDFKMVAVGRFVDKEKNFTLLIEMMRDFVKICPKSLLVLVGDGPDSEFYKLQATSYKLEKNVIIESWRDDLPSFYKSFDLYLLSSNYEGWGRTVIEAMASGLPIVMTDVGLAGEVVNPALDPALVCKGGVDRGALHPAARTDYSTVTLRQDRRAFKGGVKNEENGVVVPVADKEAMLQAVTDLYKNSELRAKFSGAGLTAVQNLELKSKEEYLQKYLESYRLCSGSAHSQFVDLH